ncbi:aminopeptidase N-like [Bradysia coprophila]|uniref:aminopeptidase N-like n=1 Tax=Bradysia coprophila TaxID=38358 RepID=UPI00187DB2E1|nr:aminopeptidase N-like [Bradysia coprophila]
MLRLTLYFLIGFVGTISSSSIPLPSPRDIQPRLDGYEYRLPNSTRPEAYFVDLTTNVHNNIFNFVGVVDIDIVVLQPTPVITLHQRQLTISFITLEPLPQTGTVIPISSFNYDPVTEFLSIHVESATLAVNDRYRLSITYTGVLRQDEAGFYRSSYVANDGTRRWLATTQFESTDARHGFPCYDEPALRANFTISIRHGAGYNAISNMPVREVVDSGNGIVVTHFQTTPPTPTYLIAFVVSDFVQENNGINADFPHATYARPNAIQGAAYSVEMGEKILKAFDDYLTIPFSHALPKMDQVAVPDFAAGAMENWGLVTYREPYLLLFENSTFTTKTNIVTIVAHEFAHQWFGNLVTPRWWTYLWLNEGFATLFEYYATNWVLPEWKILDVFVYQTLQYVLQSDAREQTRPMTHYVDAASDIENLFDGVAYDKSGSVLRMILHAITESTFKKGLVYYLTNKEFSDAAEEDLFAALNQAAKEDQTIETTQTIEAIMSTWTRQRGFPLFTVQRNYVTGEINIRQERYFTVPPSTEDSALWWIPYNFATANNPDFENTRAEGWMSPTRTSIIAQTSAKTWSSNDWIVFNKQETGYYRVMYDATNYNLIVSQLNSDFSKIHLTSRAQLIDDSFDFARTGRLNYRTAFDVVAHLEYETEYVPWGSALTHLTFVNRMLSTTSEYPQFQNFTRILIKNLYDHVGVTDKGDAEPHFQKQARIWAINWACNMGLEECLTATRNAISQQNIASIHVNVRQAVLCGALRQATDYTYVSVFELLGLETDSTERNRYISALGCSWNRNHLLDYIYTSSASSEENVFNSQAERYRVFSSVLDNGQVGLSVAIEYLRNDLAGAVSSYGRSNINSALTAIASYITTTEMESQFSSVLTLAESVTAIESSTIARANEIIAENMAWTMAYRSNIDTWIAEYHRSRGEQITVPPTDAPTDPPTSAPTEPPTDAPSSSAIITLSVLLITILTAVNLL